MSGIKDINVSNPWFSFIKNKKKRVEGRLNKGSFSQLKKGDVIKFKNGADSFIAKIRKIVKYDTFEKYLMIEGLKRTS